MAKMIPQAVKIKLIKFFEDRDENDVFPTYYRMNSRKQIVRSALDGDLFLTEFRYVETTPMASVVGPLVLPELLFLLLQRMRMFRMFRGDLIAVLMK